MKNIYEMAREAIADGAKFSVNLVNKSFSLNGSKLIENGIVRDGYTLGIEPHSQEESVRSIEHLYNVYKHSVPGERSTKSKHYFKALSYDDIPDNCKDFGEERDSAEFELTYYLLASVLTGSFKWTQGEKGWFWKSDNHPELVILREWM